MIEFEDQGVGKSADLPMLGKLEFRDTSHLIPSKYSPPEQSILERLSSDVEALGALIDTESKTNDLLVAEQGLLPGISPQELVANVPFASVINGAFTHARPEGARFNGPDRGAWYAARLRTAQAEVAFHHTAYLEEVGEFFDEVTYDDYLADFVGTYHDIRNNKAFESCLDSNSYVDSQSLAERLLAAGSLGLAFPSVRHPGGACLVCFRPALVTHVRKGQTYRFIWQGKSSPTIL